METSKQWTSRLILTMHLLVSGLLIWGAAGGARAAPQSGRLAQETGVITGTVSDENGDPIPWVGVGAGDYASMLGCGDASAWAGADGNGVYQLDVSPGTYLLFVNSHDEATAYVPEIYQDINSWAQRESATLVTVDAGQTISGVNFTLPSGYQVTGRLVDGGGNPVLGAGGNFQDPLQAIEFGCALGFGSDDTDGTFQINVPAGVYNLNFCKGAECHSVRRGLVVTDHVALGDVTFVDAPINFDPQPLESGYTVETVVLGGPNTPSDVAVLSDIMYLAAVRSWMVYRVDGGGTLTPTAAVGVYALDAGPDGNLYGYFMPGDPAPVYRITPSGTATTVGYLPLTSCESTLAVGPDGNIWIGYNYCGGTGFGDATLYRMAPDGQLFSVATGMTHINGLDVNSSGQLIMTSGEQVFEVDTGDGSRSLLATLPQGAASHGLVAAPDGTLYVSSQGEETDRVFRVTPGGDVSTLATLPDGCIQGLDRTAAGDLVATMRCTGALYLIHPDGTWETLRAGNGMATPQAMAFNRVGELLVNNDESGRIVRVVDDHGEFFAWVTSYIPPLGHMAFEPSGDSYFSEACPGFQPRLIEISPQAEVKEVTTALSFPSGLAFLPDGTLYVAENMSGEISAVAADGAVSTFVTGLTRPQSMASDAAGNLYVAGYQGILQNPGDPVDNPPSNQVWKIAPSGERAPVINAEVRVLAFSPAGELFFTGPVAGQTGVLRLDPDGQITPFATGYLSAVGLAFDIAGDLYVSDDWDNSITRITGFPQGTLGGQVTDLGNSRPIPGARLSLVTGYPVVLGTQVSTDGDGRYWLPVGPRTYRVTASAPGYVSASKLVTISDGVIHSLDFALAPGVETYLPLVLKGS